MTHRFDLVQQKVWKVTECNWARWKGAVMVIREMVTPQAKQEYSDREGNISCNAQFE